MGERKAGECERLGHLERLGHDQQPPLVGSVGDQAGPGPEEKDGPVQARPEHANRQAAVSPVQDEQGERDGGQPVAHLGDELPGEEQPEVSNPKGGERATPIFLGAFDQRWPSVAGWAGGWASRSNTGAAAMRRARSSGGSSLSTADSHAVRRVRLRLR